MEHFIKKISEEYKLGITDAGIKSESKFFTVQCLFYDKTQFLSKMFISAKLTQLHTGS